MFSVGQIFLFFIMRITHYRVFRQRSTVISHPHGDSRLWRSLTPHWRHPLMILIPCIFFYCWDYILFLSCTTGTKYFSPALLFAVLSWLNFFFRESFVQEMFLLWVNWDKTFPREPLVQKNVAFLTNIGTAGRDAPCDVVYLLNTTVWCHNRKEFDVGFVAPSLTCAMCSFFCT